MASSAWPASGAAAVTDRCTWVCTSIAARALTSTGWPPQPEGDGDRADPDEQGDGIGHDEGQVTRGDAVADPQAESDQQDREVPDRHVPGGPLPEHPADLQD